MSRSPLARIVASGILLGTAAGCAGVSGFSYRSDAKLSPPLPGTPRVSIRPIGPAEGVIFPGARNWNRDAITANLAASVLADVSANMFTGAGPDVRVVIEVRALQLDCPAPGATGRARADLTMELKAEDVMVGRFDATASADGDCGAPATDVPAIAAEAFRRAIETAKASAQAKRDIVRSRMAAVPGFGGASYGAPALAASEATGWVNVGVAELEAQDVPAGTAAVIADWLRGALVAAGSFSVVERGAMNKVLAEQALQQTGCTTSDCAVKIGRLLNVQRMIVGSVGKLLDTYVVNVRVVDVETGRVVLSDTAKGQDVEGIESAVKEMARRISR